MLNRYFCLVTDEIGEKISSWPISSSLINNAVTYFMLTAVGQLPWESKRTRLDLSCVNYAAAQHESKAFYFAIAL